MREKLSSILFLLNVCFPARATKQNLDETCSPIGETKSNAHYQNFVTMNNQLV